MIRVVAKQSCTPDDCVPIPLFEDDCGFARIVKAVAAGLAVSGEKMR